MPESPHLLVDRAGPVVVLTMNRPAARTAFSLEMLVRLAEAWEAIDGDESVRCAVLTGAEGVCSAGADLKMMAGAAPEDPRSLARRWEGRRRSWASRARRSTMNRL